MKGYELIKAITERKIKNNTKIKVKMGSTYKATLKYENLMLKWESGDFDTSILCSAEADFKVIEEKKEIEELHEYKNIGYSECDIKTNREKLNEVIRAVNKINKDLEKGQTLNIEIDEETISNAIKKARNYLEREEK